MEQIKRKKYWIIALLVVLVLAKAAYSYYQERNKPSVTVQVVRVEQGTIHSYVKASGALYARDTTRVYAKSAGVVKEVAVKENDFVKEGQILLKLDDSLLAKQVQEHQQKLQEAVQKLEQMSSLVKDGSVSAQQFAAAQLERDTAQKTYDLAVGALQQATVSSPVNGMVIGKPIAAGQSILPGQENLLALVTIADLSELEVEAKVEEKEISKIFPGQEVSFSVNDLGQQTFAGTVNRVLAKAELRDEKVYYTVLITVDPIQEVLRPGMAATISFLAGTKENVLLVPKAALKENNGIFYVQMIVKGQPVNQAVKVGLISDRMAEITSGVEKGDEILVTESVKNRATP
ncbi:MAG: efflux RND transporter periplasmic adaptor subunit [Sporomusaceae bacterium]|nr:efflux RND transporter periplasmic adaptor subunit [Sporomusaceae bacterium]